MTIWKSRKKTVKEDALKIAKRTRRRRSSAASERGAFRSDISLKEYLKKERNGAINRLHAMYGNAGIIDVRI